MPKAICEDCGSLVEAELTHNGVCAVGHYVHCGWGHVLLPDDLIQDVVAEIIAKLEAKLAECEARLEKAVVTLAWCARHEESEHARATLAELKGKDT